METSSLPAADLFKPLTQEVTHLAKSLETARAAAEEEARLRAAGESLWTPERLRLHVQTTLRERRSVRGLQSRALYARAAREGSGSDCPRQRPRHGARTHPARLRGNLGGARRRRCGPRNRGRAGPSACASRRTPIHAAPRLADQGGRGRLLLRICQRGAVAPLPHRPHAPHVPGFRLGILSKGEPQVRRCFAGGNGRNGRARGSGPGLSLCLVAPPDQRAASGRARGHFLAHSLAEPAGLRNLPVAARPAGRIAGRRSGRLSYPSPLQLLSGNGGQRAGVARGLGTLYR